MIGRINLMQFNNDENNSKKMFNLTEFDGLVCIISYQKTMFIIIGNIQLYLI